MDAPGGSTNGNSASLLSGQLMKVYDGEFAGGESSLASFGALGMRAACPFQTVVPESRDVICNCRGCPLIFLNPRYDRCGVDARYGVSRPVFETVPLCDAWPKVAGSPSCRDEAMSCSVNQPFDVAWRKADLGWVGEESRDVGVPMLPAEVA